MLVKLSAEEKLLTCTLFDFRIAPVPKYLKMHYVKEELGDSKGGVGCEMRHDDVCTSLPVWH